MPAFLHLSLSEVLRTLLIYCAGVTNTSRAKRSGATNRRFSATVSLNSRYGPEMAGSDGKSWFESVGCRISAVVADLFAHPYAQIGFIVVCVAWFAIGFNINLLTAALSIMAITLTQMVLNNQNEREAEARRRDIAMHAKLDELISASRKARNDFVGVEDRDEEEIVQLKEEVKEALEEAPVLDEPEIKETIKEAVEEALQENGHGGKGNVGSKA